MPTSTRAAEPRNRKVQETTARIGSRFAPSCRSILGSRLTLPILRILVPVHFPVLKLENIQLVLNPLLLHLLLDPTGPVHHRYRRLVPSSLYSIQYDRFFGSKYIVESIFLVAEEIYYIVGIAISHYAYRMFKASESGQGMLFNNNANNEAPLQEQAQYRALREDNIRPNNAPANNNAGGGGFFRGEGVRIG